MNKYLLLTSLMLLTLLTNLLGQEKNKEFTNENITLIDGSWISGTELTNKIIIVNIWATWCKHCIREMPDLNRLVVKYQNRENVLFLAITPDDADHSEKVKRFLEKNEFLFQHMAPNSNLTFINKNEDVRYPTTVIYNKHGELVKKFVGALNKKELK